EKQVRTLVINFQGYPCRSLCSGKQRNSQCAGLQQVKLYVHFKLQYIVDIPKLINGYSQATLTVNLLECRMKNFLLILYRVKPSSIRPQYAARVLLRV